MIPFPHFSWHIYDSIPFAPLRLFERYIHRFSQISHRFSQKPVVFINNYTLSNPFPNFQITPFSNFQMIPFPHFSWHIYDSIPFAPLRLFERYIHRFSQISHRFSQKPVVIINNYTLSNPFRNFQITPFPNFQITPFSNFQMIPFPHFSWFIYYSIPFAPIRLFERYIHRFSQISHRFSQKPVVIIIITHFQTHFQISKFSNYPIAPSLPSHRTQTRQNHILPDHPGHTI